MAITAPPFGRRIAWRRYWWTPPDGRRRRVDLEIGTPRRVRPDWGCRIRVTGLPKAIEMTVYGIDSVQALEMTLIAAGKKLAESPQFRAGRIEMFDSPIKGEAALFLPLPMSSLQGTLENLRAFLERQQEKERKLKRGWFNEEWARGLLTVMRDISGDLATLAARLPAVGRGSRKRKPSLARRRGRRRSSR